MGLAAKPLASWRPVRPAGAQAYDPYGGARGDNSQLAPLAIDGNLSTAWRTDKYATPHFGNLKPGTGLLLSMGRVVTIESVEIRLGTSPGASFQVRAGLSAARLANLHMLVRETKVAGSMDIRFRNPVHASYLAIWFTRLPPGPAGTFQASVFDIRLEGRP